MKMLFFFFFQAEDGIRDGTVTGVQTCALPILWLSASDGATAAGGVGHQPQAGAEGRAGGEPLVRVAAALGEDHRERARAADRPEPAGAARLAKPDRAGPGVNGGPDLH